MLRRKSRQSVSYTCEGEQRLQTNDWIKNCSYQQIPVLRMSSRQEELRVRQQMDSVYEALQGRRGFCNAGPPVLG